MPPPLGTYETTPHLWPFAVLTRAFVRAGVDPAAGWAMPLWRAGAVFGQGFPPDLPPGVERVSREEWPQLPDNYESLSRPEQRALYYQGVGPRPETEAQDMGMLTGMGVDPAMLAAGMIGGNPPDVGSLSAPADEGGA